MKSSKKVNRTILAQYASGLQCAPSETVRGFESHPLRHSFVFSGLGSFLRSFPKTSSTSPETPASAVLRLERTAHHGNFKVHALQVCEG